LQVKDLAETCENLLYVDISYYVACIRLLFFKWSINMFLISVKFPETETTRSLMAESINLDILFVGFLVDDKNDL